MITESPAQTWARRLSTISLIVALSGTVGLWIGIIGWISSVLHLNPPLLMVVGLILMIGGVSIETYFQDRLD